MQETKDWYALYTRPRWEKKVAEALSKKHIENFCPQNREVHQWGDRKKYVCGPLFSSYVFVYASALELPLIRRMEGILSVVHWLGTPARITDAEIRVMRQLATGQEHIELEKIDVNPADKVRVMRGPVIKLNGSVMQVKNRTVKVCLPSLGYALIAEISKDTIGILGMEETHEAYIIPQEIYG